MLSKDDAFIMKINLCYFLVIGKGKSAEEQRANSFSKGLLACHDFSSM